MWTKSFPPGLSQVEMRSNRSDYDGNAWNILTGAEISTRFLADIRNHIDRIGSCINQHEIDLGINVYFLCF